MNFIGCNGRMAAFNYLDKLSRGIPFTHTRACHLLYGLVAMFPHPKVVEVACGYGKATLYLTAAAKLRNGCVRCVDFYEQVWEGKSAKDLLRQACLLDVCQVTYGQDARWYLIELLSLHPDRWIDFAYVDATHTVEVDSFLALALWTHMRPGGILALDDLDWTAATHAPDATEITAPTISHVRKIFDYISKLPDVDDRCEWGGNEVEWNWGFLRKGSDSTANSRPIGGLIQSLDNNFPACL
jgi:predicted O-methyltransferase YrrM